jgi:taurine dioxygenase
MAEAPPHGIEVIPMGAALGAEIRGLDLRAIESQTVEAIRTAWHRHLVVVFRDQDMAGDLSRFSRRFGELDPAPVDTQGMPSIPEHPEIAVISNIVEDGAPIGALGAFEAAWHTDMSYRPEPPSASLLFALEVPDEGGDTGFANMYLACQELSAALRDRAEGRAIKHDASHDSAGQLRRRFEVPANPREAPGASHPIIRTHPATSAKALFLGRRRNAYVDGLEMAESEALLDALWAFATRPEFTWHHQWAPGDLVVWDNRCTLHRRDAFDADARRLMLRTQVKGSRPA